MPKSLYAALAVVLANCAMASDGAVSADPFVAAPNAKAPIVLAANGCGRGFFRTIDGACIPNPRVVGPGGRRGILPPPCPRGFLRDPDPARPLCYPIY